MRAKDKLLIEGWCVRSEAYKIKTDLAAVMSHSADHDFEVVVLLLLHRASCTFTCHLMHRVTSPAAEQGNPLYRKVEEAPGYVRMLERHSVVRPVVEAVSFADRRLRALGSSCLSARPACAPGKVSKDRGVALLWVGQAVPPFVACAACRNDARRCCLRTQLMVQTSKQM